MKKATVIIFTFFVALAASEVSATKPSKKPDFVATIGDLIEIAVTSDQNSSIKAVGAETARLLVTLAKQIWDFVCKDAKFKKSTVGELCDKPTLGTALTVAYKIAKFMHTLNIPSRVMNYISKQFKKPTLPIDSGKGSMLKGYNKGQILEGYFIPDKAAPVQDVGKIKGILSKTGLKPKSKL